MLVVVGCSLGRDVRFDLTHAPGRIVFGGVGVVGKEICVRGSFGRVVIPGRAPVRGSDVADEPVANVMVAGGSGVDRIVEVEESPYLSVGEVRTGRYGLGVALALRHRSRMARAVGTRRGRAAIVRIVDRRGADAASCPWVVVVAEVHDVDDFGRGGDFSR